MECPTCCPTSATRWSSPSTSRRRASEKSNCKANCEANEGDVAMTVALNLKGRETDLGGGFVVRRMLPAAPKQAVGPFVFFDHFGPVVQQPGDNFDVRPHPHIGLATV